MIANRISVALWGTVASILIQTTSIALDAIDDAGAMYNLSATARVETFVDGEQTPSLTMRNRIHFKRDASTAMVYPPTQSELIESDLLVSPDYTNSKYVDSRIDHFVIESDLQQKYSLGSGQNHLDIYTRGSWENAPLLLYSGLGVRTTLEQGEMCSSGEFVLLPPESINSQIAPDAPWPYSNVYRVIRESDPTRVVLEFRLFSSSSTNGPFEKVEFYVDGKLARTVESSDFRKLESGIVFPFVMEVTEELASPIKRRFTFEQVLVNSELEESLFSSIRINPDATITRHLVGEDGTEVVFDDVQQRASDLVSAIDIQPDSQNEPTARISTFREDIAASNAGIDNGSTPNIISAKLALLGGTSLVLALLGTYCIRRALIRGGGTE